MKQKNFVSKFLQIDAQFLKTKQTSQTEILALPPFKTEVKKANFLPREFRSHAPVIESLLTREEVSAKAEATCLVRFAGQAQSHLLLVSLGHDKRGINQKGGAERLRRLGAVVYKKLEAEKIRSAIVHFDSFFVSQAKLGISFQEACSAFCQGLGLASYKFDRYFTDKKETNAGHEKLHVVVSTLQKKRLPQLVEGLNRAASLLAGVRICRDLSNEPPNEVFPESLAEYAKKVALESGLKCEILKKDVLQKENMNLLLGVGQGSSKPPCLIVLEYVPKGASKKKKVPTLALVGKGITFDSGGISIKPSAHMEEMKHDMSGASAVLGAIVAAARIGVQCRILAVIASAENMPSGTAISPGQILRSRSGKTVEITNTDAEGRLVLADALDWVQDKNPNYIVDIATLTGAASITLGKACAGLMGNDSRLLRKLEGAAIRSGEKLWELPLFDDYFEDLKSDVADLRNSGDSSAYGTAKGGMFLMKFIRSSVAWAHLDIAAVAWANPSLPYNPKKGATGFGVRLLLALAEGIN